jgi:hypothetical protein
VYGCNILIEESFAPTGCLRHKTMLLPDFVVITAWESLRSVRDIEILTISAAAQQKNMEQKEHQMMEMMQDSTMRSMMMDHMAENPEMRKQMMQRMMRSGEMNHSVMMGNMQNMMNNPEMKERMQEHLQMMQSMLNEGEMNHSKMMDMMQESPMMEMHMQCMQMMQSSEKE